MTKTKAMIASLALVAVAMAPLALAHNDPTPWLLDTQLPAPVGGDLTRVGQDGQIPDVWQLLTGSTDSPVDPPLSDFDKATNGQDRVSGVYYKDVSLLAGNFAGNTAPGNATNFLLGAANALCDMEVLSDGSAPGANEDEPEVDGNPGGLLTTTLFDDGGIGAVCHTHQGYYNETTFNTSGCGAKYTTPATAEDYSSLPVWLSTVCDYGYSTGGIGLASYLLSCANELFTNDPVTAAGKIANCALSVAGCFVDLTLACPLSTGFACGPDAEGRGGIQTPGNSGWSNVGVAFDSPPVSTPPAATDCADSDGAAAVFVWTAVFVDTTTSPLPTVDVSVPTIGVIY